VNFPEDAGALPSELVSLADESVENKTGQTFLRGCRITDSSRAVTFKTIVSGWCSGRIIHIHVMIRTRSSSGSVLTEFTTQLFFVQTLSNALTASVSPDRSRGPPDTGNAEDRDRFQLDAVDAANVT
jgi:protocatechuate 3,4-dioxygenase beta subunit